MGRVIGMYLLDVGFSFSAMPRLGLCVTAPLGAVGGRDGLGIGVRLSHKKGCRRGRV